MKATQLKSYLMSFRQQHLPRPLILINICLLQRQVYWGQMLIQSSIRLEWLCRMRPLKGTVGRALLIRDWKFIMPGSIVNVEPRFVQKTTSGLLFPIQIIDNAHGTIEILDAGKKVNQVEPNHSYTIRITADKNYRLLRNAFNGSEANAEYGLLLTDGTWSAAAVAGATVASPSGILSPGYVYATSPASTSWKFHHVFMRWN